MSNKPNQTLTINYQADAPLKLDDVLYIVEIADSGQDRKSTRLNSSH